MTASVSIHDAKRTTKTALKAVAVLSVVLTLVFVLSFFFSEQGISELQSARRRVQTLQADIDRLKAENSRLREATVDLRESTFTVESIARVDLGMSKPGEVVYVLK